MWLTKFLVKSGEQKLDWALNYIFSPWLCAFSGGSYLEWERVMNRSFMTLIFRGVFRSNKKPCTVWTENSTINLLCLFTKHQVFPKTHIWITRGPNLLCSSLVPAVGQTFSAHCLHFTALWCGNTCTKTKSENILELRIKLTVIIILISIQVCMWTFPMTHHIQYYDNWFFS